MNFLIKKFSPTCLLISILFIIYTIYRSEIYWEGNNRSYYYIYYIISSVLFSFSIISFYISKNLKKYFIIIFITTIFSLYLAEAFIGNKVYNKNYSKEQIKKEKLYKKLTGKKYDTRTKFEIYDDLRKEDQNIVVIVPPKKHLIRHKELFPLSGISNSKTIYCIENGYYAIYQSDRYGFNNPDQEWDNNEFEFLIIGDSFAQGSCLNRPHDIGSVLRKISKRPVLNLGYGGSAPLIEFATLREYLDTNVNKVLWLYTESNDLTGLVQEIKANLLMKYIEDLNFTQNIKSKQDQVDKMAKKKTLDRYNEVKKENKLSFKIMQFFKIYNLRRFITRSIQPELKPDKIKELSPEFIKIIKLANDFTKKKDAKLYFVYLPDYERYVTNYDNTMYIKVKNFVNELNIPFIDIHEEVFLKEQNPLDLFPFNMQGHYNIEGYKKVAETIYKYTQ